MKHRQGLQRPDRDELIQQAQDQVSIAAKVEAMQQTEGWAVVVDMMSRYKKRSYKEWLLRDMSDEEYRAICVVLDEWFSGSLEQILAQGKTAESQLAKLTGRGKTE